MKYVNYWLAHELKIFQTDIEIKSFSNREGRRNVTFAQFLFGKHEKGGLIS